MSYGIVCRRSLPTNAMNLRDKGKRTDKEMIEFYLDEKQPGWEEREKMEKELGYCAPLAKMIEKLNHDVYILQNNPSERGFSKPETLLMFICVLLVAIWI